MDTSSFGGFFKNLTKSIAEGQAELDREFSWAWDMYYALKNESLSMYVEPVTSFVTAVDWTERWILGLFAFHAILYVVAICLRKNPDALVIYFFFIMMLAWFSQHLSDLGDKYWYYFASENYFYPRDVFVSFAWTAPLLLLAVLIIGRIFIHIFQLLVQRKIRQLKKEMAARKVVRDAEADAASGKRKGGKPKAPGVVDASPTAAAESAPPTTATAEVPAEGPRKRKKK